MGGDRLIGCDIRGGDEVVKWCSSVILNVVEVDDHSMGEAALPFVWERGAHLW